MKRRFTIGFLILLVAEIYGCCHCRAPLPTKPEPPVERVPHPPNDPYHEFDRHPVEI